MYISYTSDRSPIENVWVLTSVYQWFWLLLFWENSDFDFLILAHPSMRERERCQKILTVLLFFVSDENSFSENSGFVSFIQQKRDTVIFDFLIEFQNSIRLEWKLFSCHIYFSFCLLKQKLCLFHIFVLFHFEFQLPHMPHIFFLQLNEQYQYLLLAINGYLSSVFALSQCIHFFFIVRQNLKFKITFDIHIEF